ncbi:MAG: BatD family protein [Adhaeribacter sp.]
MLLFLAGPAYAQQGQVQLELGASRLPITEYFTLSLKLRGVPRNTVGDFPEIDGFQKSKRTITRARITVGKKAFIEETITQNYAALKEGVFVLKPFSIQVNGQQVSSKGKTIRVDPVPPAEAPVVPEPKTAIPVAPLKEQPLKNSQSYLALEADQKQVRIGEGAAVRLFFYLAAEDQGYLDFHDFANQYQVIARAMKQSQVWEEAYEVNSSQPDTLQVDNKTFLRFRLAENIYYPLGKKELEFPALSLTMVQWPKDAGFAAGSRSQALVTFKSKPLRIGVQALPGQDGQQDVQVGDYRLQEGMDRTGFRAGQSFTYSFTVAGTGNLKALTMPALQPPAGLEIFPPAIRFRPDPQRKGSGSTTFHFTLLARQPGNYALGKIFYLPFFNPASGRYDTLRSELQIRVGSARDLPAFTRPGEADPFYKLIRTESNSLSPVNKIGQIKLYTNLVILFLICASLYVFYKK